MHVGLNALYLVPGAVGGVEVYARELTAALAAGNPTTRFTVFCGIEGALQLRRASWPPNVRIVRVPVNASIKPLRVATELFVLPLYVALARVDLLHSLGTTSPIAAPAVRVVTIHDLIFHHFPRTFAPLAQKALSVIVPMAARRAHRVITDSEATRQDLVSCYGISSASIDVVHLGRGMQASGPSTDERALRTRWSLGESPLVLAVAAALEHKNLPRLLEAFVHVHARAGPGGPRPILLIVGHFGRDGESLQGLAAKLGIGGAVRFTGWVAAEELEGLYQVARCCIYPSLYEGFGMPVLEAMARGIPVACSRATALPEVAGDAALLFDPLDVDDMAAALARVLWDEPLRDAQIRRGRLRSLSFSWESTASATVASYRRALGLPDRAAVSQLQ